MAARGGAAQPGEGSTAQTLSSSLPAASVRPSGLNATELTAPAGPVRGWPSRAGPVEPVRFQSQTWPSALPAARIRPSRLNATESTMPMQAGQGREKRDRPGRVGEVPQPDSAVVAAGGERPPVPAERDRELRGRLVRTLDGRFHSRMVLPYAADGQGPPVRAERHREDSACRAGQGLAEQDRAGRVGEVPQPDLVIGAARRQGPPVRAERHRGNNVRRGRSGAGRAG